MKIGFIYEVIVHKFLDINGVWKDHLHFALINKDYKL